MGALLPVLGGAVVAARPGRQPFSRLLGNSGPRARPPEVGGVARSAVKAPGQSRRAVRRCAPTDKA
eukprot:1233225-Lingulodinium_polyedra.AAC.1